MIRNSIKALVTVIPQMSEMVKGLRDMAKKGDQRAFYDILYEHLNMWQTVPIKLAVIGESGSGKSSFINALRGISEDDEDAAEVGVTETTTTVRDYPHQTHKNLVLYDLPGVGTSKFPKESYLEKINVDQFDFFIVVSSKRFKDNDMWIAKEINRRKKKFYFVRTMIDIDVYNDSRKKNRKGRPQDTMNQVREDIQCQLSNEFEVVPHIFLISNHDTDKFDFSKLTIQMVNDTASGKRDAFVFALTHPSNDMIGKKSDVLAKRIERLAYASAMTALIPLPGVNRLFDIIIIQNELKFYKEQFGTDEQSIKNINEKFDISFDGIFEYNSSMLLRSTSMLYDFIFEKGRNPKKERRNVVLKIVRGLLGNRVGAYKACKNSLHDLLAMCTNGAMVLNAHIVDKVYPDQ